MNEAAKIRRATYLIQAGTALLGLGAIVLMVRAGEDGRQMLGYFNIAVFMVNLAIFMVQFSIRSDLPK